MSQKKTWLGLILASLFISINWLTYIFAVNMNHIVEASLGYYVNPLVSVLLGVFVLREKVNEWQAVSFVLAGIGVIYMTLSVGKLPWISLILALSFGFYGLSKKTNKSRFNLGPAIGNFICFPLCNIVFSVFRCNDQHSFSNSIPTDLFLLGLGIVTALPLLWFGIGAEKYFIFIRLASYNILPQPLV